MPEVDPALAALAVWCDLRDGTAQQTVTSGDTIWIGSGFAELPAQEQIGMLGRHILHVALRHEISLIEFKARGGEAMTSDAFVMLADALVNECLSQGGHALPRPAVMLREILSSVDTQDTGSRGDRRATWDADRLFLEMNSRGTAALSCLEAYGRARSYAPSIHPAAPDAAREKSKAEWSNRLILAARAGGSMGRGIGRALQAMTETAASRTPWERHLRGLLAGAIAPLPRQSFRRPRSAWIAREADAVSQDTPRPVFEPAISRQRFGPRIVVGLDSSGSVSERQLAMFMGEVSGIARKAGAETHVMCFDEEVYAQCRLDPLAPQASFNALRVRRDGGTSFVDLMSRAAALSPAAIVVLTDGAGAFGPAPRCRVIWASPVPVASPPPFGEVIELMG